MRKIAFVLAAFVIGCGGSSTTVSTSSAPPAGSGSDGGVATPTPGGGGGAGGMPGGAGGTGGTGGSGGGSAGGGVGGGGGGRGGQACTLTGPTRLAASHAVIKMLVDGDQLYYLDVASAFSGLYRIPTSGGTPTLVDGVLDEQDDGSGQDFALDDRAAYVTYDVLDDTSPNRNQVTIVDKATLSRRSVSATAYGCTVPVIAQLGAWGGTAWLGQHNDVGTPPCSPPFDSIEVLAAGAATSNSINRLASGSLALLVDGTHVFWSNGGAVFRELHDGSMKEQLAPIAADRLVTEATRSSPAWARTSTRSPRRDNTRSSTPTPRSPGIW